MAYTLQQAMEVAGLTTAQKEFLADVEKANVRLGRETTYDVKNDKELKAELNKRIAANEKQKEAAKKRSADYAECLTIVRRMVGRIKGEKSIIRAAELKEKLLALEETVKAEKKFSKVDKALATTGMTKEQLIEYLQSK